MILSSFAMGCTNNSKTSSETDETAGGVAVREVDGRVEVDVNGQFFTAYIHPERIKKPALWPLKTAQGHSITRAYPMEAAAGERVDHPHHVGLWFNYGDVNGLDFWNNSEAIPEERLPRYGHIEHEAVVKTESGLDQGTLEVKALWKDHEGNVLLEENTTYVFRGDNDERSVDRITTLTAVNGDVSFADNKEGVLGLRVTHSLEHPSNKPVIFTDAQGNPTDVPVMDNEGVTGRYYTSEGVEGEDAWGTRADWVNLFGQVNGESVNVVIFDHPDNVGYPTYWHARGYGLFAANPLGQAVFSDGAEMLNFALQNGESVTFKHRVLLLSGERASQESLNQRFNAFASE
jgi:hypothetical protein